jgi:light-regulated signal transduction histidine kinase (bacteriophytochrome)/CheY-like chemotaxis protein
LELTVTRTDANEVWLHSDSRCDAREYRRTGLVQAHAALIVLDGEALTVRQVSANAGAVLGRPAEAIIGRPLMTSDLFENAVELLPLVADAPHREPVLTPTLATPDGRLLTGRLHRSERSLLLELEPDRMDVDHDIRDTEGLLHDVIAASASAPSLPNFLDDLVQVVRQHLRFDRVVVGRFDEEFHGQFIAECCHPELAPHIDLRFPSTDFPRSARAIMHVNPLRTSCDQSSELVPLVGSDPDDGPVDLARTRIRGVGGPCQQFYRNLGIRATMITAIHVRGRLWGLLSARHRREARIHPRFDEVMLAVSRVVSTTIDRFETEARIAAEEVAADLQRSIAEISTAEPLWVDHLQARLDTLRDVLSADALVVLVGDQRIQSGRLAVGVATETIRETIGRLVREGHEPGTPLPAHRVAADHPDLDFGGLAGLLAVPLPSGTGDVVVWLRREQESEIAWLGRPVAIAEPRPGEPAALVPRASFNRWLEVVRGSCRTWTPDEIRLAGTAALHVGIQITSWQATRSTRSKSEFLTNMSHELRTPLTAILGFAEVLMEEHEDSHVGRASATIQRQGTHLLTLINDILDLSKIEAGKMEIVPADTSLPALMQDVNELLSGRAADKGLGFHVAGHGALPATVRTDSIRVKQVLVNLAGNAIKFTESGDITITVRWRAATKAADGRDDPAGRGTPDPTVGDHRRGHIVVDVRDTGVGMAPEELARVFHPFEQANATTSRTHGGTGLGLAISRQLARQLGGEVTAESRPGGGSTFRFSFDPGPVDPGSFSTFGNVASHDPAALPIDASASPARPATAVDLFGRTILLAEDSPDNQRLIGFHLRKAGARVEVAENGRAALERLAALRDEGIDPDVILMDMMMPEMDGYAATRALRAQGDTIRVIALTAHAMAGDRERCIEAGCDDYATKPIKKSRLLDAVARWLDCPATAGADLSESARAA